MQTTQQLLLVFLLALIAPALARDSIYQRFVTVSYRDFTPCHPDFLFAPPQDSGVELGIVAADLGADGKPVYALPADGAGSRSTSGAANFNQWFNDDESVNLRVTYRNGLTLGALPRERPVQPQIFRFCSPEGVGFFPLDYQLFGNGFARDFNDPAFPNVEPRQFAHNYLFTAEVHASFTYRPGAPPLEFFADDDLFVFLDGRLAVDLGGRHSVTNSELLAATRTVDLDAFAAARGWTEGQEIDYALFYAERQTSEIDGIAAALCFDLPASDLSCGQLPATVEQFERNNNLHPEGLC